MRNPLSAALSVSAPGSWPLVSATTTAPPTAEEDRKRHLLRLWLSFPRRRSLRALPTLGREAVRLVAALGAGRLRKRLHARDDRGPS
jgi:hypothetical protein